MIETVDFQSTETSDTQDVTFTFDASELVGKSVVAFEELSLNGEFCAEHKDKDDENQIVTFPGIQTTARDNVTGSCIQCNRFHHNRGYGSLYRS